MRLKSRRLIGIIGSIMLVVVMAVTAVFPDFEVFAQEEKRTVRVGIFSLGKFQYLDEAGDAGGYNAEYLDKIAKVAHWNYEWVPVENWIDATEKLESGDIDLLAPAQITTDLKSRFDYAAYEMGTEFGAVYTKDSRETLLYGDYQTMSELTYGVAQNSTFARQFKEEYCVDAGFEPKTVDYANTTELMEALETGEVDAVVTNIMFAEDGLKLLGRLTPLPVYYITTQGNEEILNELNEALTTLRFSNPTLASELMVKYFPIIQDTQQTYKERTFVAETPAIRIGYEVDHEPLSYTDSNGEFAGITRDILDRISAISGLTFEYVPLPATDVTSEYLSENHIYVLANVEYNRINESKKRMALSTTYLESEKVMVAKSELTFDEEAALNVVIPTGSETLIEEIKDEFVNFTIDKSSTVEASFESVRKGDVDALIVNRYVAERLLNKPLYSTLKIIPLQSLEDQLCLSTIQFEGNDENEELLTDGTFINVVDKAIRQLNKSEINSIIITNTSKSAYRMTFMDFVYQYRYTFATVAALLILCVVLVIYSERMKNIKNHQLEQKNTALAEAVSMAERANSAKSQFLSKMSHEIRTPMNAIVGITTIAKAHENDPGKIDDYLNKISISSKVLLSIINDVLDMSAIESDKIKIAHEEFDLKGVLNGITAIYYPQCKDKGIDLNVAVNTEDEILVGDSLRVNQILMNLVSNAYKFTPRGGKISILISQLEQRSHQVFLRFIVADTGCGMSEEMLGRLFKPFEQESETTAREHGGSGLGMSIAKNLVDLMHGAIKVTSKKDEGTTFTVDIPFDIAEKERMEVKEKVKDIRALVVDDDTTAREYTSIVLNRIGVRYDTAESGKKALELIAKAHEEHKDYDICFLDWKMPEMDGLSVTKAIREKYDKNTVIIIVSAYDLSEVEDVAKDAGADMFVPKPLFQSTVFDALMDLSGGKYTKNTSAKKTYDFGGKRVLLAEDNEINAEIAKDLLEMVNLQTDHAEDGKKAVEMFKASIPGNYSAILMDVQMPVMDGYDATKAIRLLDHPDAVNIPILAMTANAFTEDISAALSSGMNGHIAKPVDADLLYETLDKFIKQ